MASLVKRTTLIVRDIESFLLWYESVLGMRVFESGAGRLAEILDSLREQP